MNTRLLFNFSATIEALTGLALLAAPLFVIGLLLGDGLGSTGVAVARVLGIALLSVGIATWELPGQDSRFAPRAGLCVYNVGAASCIAMIGTYSGMAGVLLWPTVGLHAVLGAAMLFALFR